MRNEISQLVQDVVDGNESAAKAWSILKEIDSLIKAGLSEIEPIAMDEAREFNTKEKHYGGYWIIGSTQTILDYSQDEYYSEYDQKAKERKKMLTNAWKAHHQGSGFFDSNTGEEIPILPVKTPSKEMLIYKPEKK